MSYDFKNFGDLLFDMRKMKEKLPSPIYKRFIEAINHEEPLDITIADVIAHNMKVWAIEHGCTHFTHWFHPLTGSTAEKHNSFIEEKDGEPIARFTGKALIKDEPDASSFPNGGLRATFEARGYTYWDCESPAFIRDHVLYIPTVFISFTGESLDTKGPLLKSVEAIDKAAVKMMHLLGKNDVTSVKPYIGLEQEYFLVDKKDFLQRRDLYLTNKTLLGLLPPKGQQLEKHYFGPIPARVNSFMEDVNAELWNLGIYAKAEHNEVAPGQFELAPIFSNVNIAVDQNMITMEILQKVALKHDFVVLLHEKPYQGVNGSGKHNNYSLMTNTGENLFKPSKKAEPSLTFLVFVSALIRAVDDNAELIRLLSSNPGNDFRLGANEAPPAIISMYLSQEIENIFASVAKGKSLENISKNMSNFAMKTITNLPKDKSDRNRTSPIAFTGNKFEFRTLGSSMNASELNIIINTALAESINNMVDEIQACEEKDMTKRFLKVISDIYTKHERILFSGNGYSDAWVKEAEKRGLPNIKTFVEAISALESEKAEKLFIDNKVFTKKEVEARVEVKYENYYNIRSIEYKTLCEMIYQEIIPSAIKELNFITTCGREFMSNSMLAKVEKLKTFIDEVSLLTGEIDDKLKEIEVIDSYKEKGLRLLNEVTPLTEKVRNIVDKLEKYISKDNQPYPQYEELFFGIDF